jgi:hypothetical protein
MRKLKLDLDAIHVDSFEVRSPGVVRPGTVHAAQDTKPSLTLPQPPDTTDDIFCISVDPCIPSNEPTCGAATCMHTCYPTCYC